MEPGRRIGRRAFLGGAVGAGVVAGGGGLAWALTRDGDADDPAPTSADPSPTRTLAPTPTSTPAGPTPTMPPSGGHARLSARTSFVFDTFDAVQSGEPSVVEVLGRTHRRAIEWSSFEEGTLGAGMAESWEQVSPTSLVLTVAPDTWPGAEGLEARAVEAEDIAEHLRRTVEMARSGEMPLSQRPWDYLSIDRVEAAGDGTIRIDTSRPDPFLVQTLAGRFALVQRPEAIELHGGLLHERRPEHLSGTGPFVYTGFGGNRLQFQARQGGAALLDSLEVAPAGGDINAFLGGELDEYIARDRRDAPEIREERGSEVVEQPVFEDSPVVSTFAVGGPPWNNPALVGAVSGALNRGWLIDALFAGRARASGIVSPAAAVGFRPLVGALAPFPGYGDNPAQDAADARNAWEANGGPGLGTIELDVPSVFDPLYSAASTVAARLREVLGADVRPSVVAYSDIAQRLADGYYGNGRAALWFGWGTALTGPDPSRWLLETFHSGSETARAAGYSDAGTDQILDRLAEAFLVEERHALVADVVRKLASGSSGYLPFALQTAEQFVAAPLHGRVSSPYWSQHLDAGAFVSGETE